MKKITLVVIISLLELSSFAAKKKPVSNRPKYYFYMRKGRLIEKYNGHYKVVHSDVTLVNHSTIHPNGTIDAGSGESLQLKKGQFLTMDGRIRPWKEMPE